MTLLARLRLIARRLTADTGGNVIIMTGAAVFMLTFAVGFGIDYARAQRLQTKLNAAADAAALAAVDPSLLTQDWLTAQHAAENIFDAQVAGLDGLTIANRLVTVKDTPSGSLGIVRTAQVTYTATSTNSFGGLLKAAVLPINGHSQALASMPPSINFYVALDMSPSMLLPTTATGIANLKAGAIWKGESVYYPGYTDGCDFACHSNDMQQWNAGTYVIDNNSRMIFTNNGANAGTVPFYRVSCASGTNTPTVYDNNGNAIGSNASIVNAATSGKVVPTLCTQSGSFNQNNNKTYNPVYISYTPTGSKSNVTVSVNYPDTWWLVRNYTKVNPGSANIELRTDAMAAAVGGSNGLIQTAFQVEDQNKNTAAKPTYKMQFFTFNLGNPALLATPFNTMADVKDIKDSPFPDLGGNAPLMCANTYWTDWTTNGTSKQCTTQTNNADTSFSAMLTWMQKNIPTGGDGSPSSTPQNVLLIVTDGANDDSNGRSQLSPSAIDQCNSIKSSLHNNTRIAILYTQYIPETINYTQNGTFNSFAKENVPYIQQQLQACASRNADGTYLMQTVTTDGSITAALNALFAMTVQSARLVE